AVSSIAWAPEEDPAIATLLRARGVQGVELAPTKWRTDPFHAPAKDVAALRRWWEDRGFSIVSLQSLLFEHPELQLFGSDASRSALASFLKDVLDFAHAVGAGAVVFGSPKNRLRGALSNVEAMAIAESFLRALGDYARDSGVAFCVEANPPGYGCDFVTTTAEAVELVRRVNHPGICVNGDLGGMTMAGEDPRSSIEAARGLIGHFHASEPNLAEIVAVSDHARAAEGLATIGYDRWVSIEMRAVADGNHIAAVDRAVQRVQRAYGSGS
ncbi:MAG TPA: sugar phosphate isomerase/epimerase family protein, partial [Gemmatimonadaceae bacterium]